MTDEKKYADEADVNKAAPHRIEDPVTGKKKLVLGKVGFDMGLRRPGEPRKKAEDSAPKPVPTFKATLEG